MTARLQENFVVIHEGTALNSGTIICLSAYKINAHKHSHTITIDLHMNR